MIIRKPCAHCTRTRFKSLCKAAAISLLAMPADPSKSEVFVGVSLDANKYQTLYIANQVDQLINCI